MSAQHRCVWSLWCGGLRVWLRDGAVQPPQGAPGDPHGCSQRPRFRGTWRPRLEGVSQPLTELELERQSQRCLYLLTWDCAGTQGPRHDPASAFGEGDPVWFCAGPWRRQQKDCDTWIPGE